MVKRSDGKGNIVCSVEIPDTLKQTGLLKVGNNAEADVSGRCEFVLNPRAAEDAGRVSESLYVFKTKNLVCRSQFNSRQILSEVTQRLMLTLKHSAQIYHLVEYR